MSKIPIKLPSREDALVAFTQAHSDDPMRPLLLAYALGDLWLDPLVRVESDEA